MRLNEFSKPPVQPAKPRVKDIPLEHSGLGSFLERMARADGIKGVHLANLLAHAKVETAGFTSLVEWGSGRQYEGNRDLGNIYPGDGVRFKGRGFLHLTGRENYTRASKELYGDDRLAKNPDLVSTNTKIAADTALWFWNKFIRPNYKASDVQGVTRRLNGPRMHGLKERLSAFKNYLMMMGVQSNPIKKAEVDSTDTMVAQNDLDQVPQDMAEQSMQDWLAEMDSQGYSGSRERKSMSTYGSRDKHNNSNGPDIHLGAGSIVNPKNMVSHLHKSLDRALSKEKKASPAQVQRNKERWAKRQAERNNEQEVDEAGISRRGFVGGLAGLAAGGVLAKGGGGGGRGGGGGGRSSAGGRSSSSGKGGSTSGHGSEAPTSPFHPGSPYYPAVGAVGHGGTHSSQVNDADKKEYIKFLTSYADAIRAGKMTPEMRKWLNAHPEVIEDLKRGKYGLTMGQLNADLVDIESRKNYHLMPKNEASSPAIANAAKRLTDPNDGKVTKLRAAGDKRREEQLKGRDIVKRDRTSKDEWGNLKETMAEIEEWLVQERGKASRSLCTSSKPDDELGASQLASCKSQGLRARDGEKSHLIGHRGSKVRVTVGGKKIKGKKYGGPLPDYGTRKNQL